MEREPKAILVTGATGFVGFHVVQSLLDAGTPVRALVRPSSRRRDLDDLFAAGDGSRSEEARAARAHSRCVVGDILLRDSLYEAMSGCEAVFHVAADYRLWARDSMALYATNVEGTLNVLRVAADVAIRRVVYTSTVGTLGIPADGSPGTEDTPVSLEDMAGHYKRSKFLAEQAARHAAKEHGIELVIVHPSTPVGERDLKPTPTGRIILDFLNRRMPAYVDTGLNLVDVRDVALGHVLAYRQGVPNRSYILGNRNMTLREILEELSRISGIPAPRVRLPYWLAYGIGAVDTLVVGRILGREPRASLEAVRMAAKKMYFSAQRAITELGLPQSSVTEALRRAVEWYVAHGYCPPPPSVKREERTQP